MCGSRNRLFFGAFIATASLPIAWALLYEPKEAEPDRSPARPLVMPSEARQASTISSAFLTPAPRDAGRQALPAQCPKPEPERRRPIRREPLEESALAEGLTVLCRLRGGWLREFQEEERQQANGPIGVCGFVSGPFEQQSRRGWTELDLFLRGYPELAEGWAVSIAEDSTVPWWERDRALDAVHALSWWGFQNAKSAGRRLRNDSNAIVHSKFSQWVDEPDSPEVVREAARSGVIWAIEALVKGPDARASEILDEIEEHQPPLPPFGDPAWVAKECRVRLAAFSCGNWQEVAKGYIQHAWILDEYLWAFDAAKVHRAGWLPDALRSCLDEYHKRWFQWEYHQFPSGGDRGWKFDEALLTLVEIGGTLRDDERTYLRKYGYACEPRARLAEILDEKRYPR